MKVWLLGALLAWGLSGAAQAQVAMLSICYNYDCRERALVMFSAARMAAVTGYLRKAADAADERERLARVLGRLYRWAGEQSPVGADRGGNFADQEVDGRMDCLDHTANNGRLLGLLAERGALRFHRPVEPERRSGLVLQHYSAAIETLPQAGAVPDHVPVLLALCDCPDVLADGHAPAQSVQRFVVDSWFVDNGEPAVILPLAQWINGGGPDVR